MQAALDFHNKQQKQREDTAKESVPIPPTKVKRQRLKQERASIDQQVSL